MNPKDDYVDAIIKVRVHKWQIGEEVSVYFPDTMTVKGKCERDLGTAHWELVDENYSQVIAKCSECGNFLLMEKCGKKLSEYAPKCENCGAEMCNNEPKCK